MNKKNFFLKINVRRISFSHGLAPETTDAIAWNSVRMKEKSTAESEIQDRPISLPKEKYVSPAPELAFFPAASKTLNVHNTLLHSPQFLLCLNDEVVTLDRKIPLKPRGVQLPNCVRTLLLCEENRQHHNSIWLFFFFLFTFFLNGYGNQNWFRVARSVCHFCVLTGWERAQGL